MSHSEKTEEEKKPVAVDADADYPDEVNQILEKQLSKIKEKMDLSVSCDENCGPTIDKVAFFTSDSLQEHESLDKRDQGLRWQNFVNGVLENQRSVVVGPFGSGKSTIAMQLVVQCTKSEDACPIFFKFSDMNHEDNISFKQLIKFTNPDISSLMLETAFDWFKKNQKKLLFILDACDEADWWGHMDKVVPHCDYEKEVPIWHLVGNLLNGHLFGASPKVFTSRYSSLLWLHHSFRPKICYRVNNLSDFNIQQIMLSCLQPNASAMWSKMVSCGEEIVLLAGNPWFLQFIINNLQSNKDCTLTGWMQRIVQSMCTSSHSRLSGMHEKLNDIQKLASRVLESNSNWFGFELLNEVGLSMEAVQDLIVASPGTSCWNDKIVKRNIQLRIFDPLLKDYFTACHVISLSDETFEEWLTDRVLFRDSRQIRFISGLLFSLQGGTSETGRKQDIFVTFLKKHARNDNDDSLLFLLENILEGGPLLSEKFAENFPSSLKWSSQLTYHKVKAICNWLESTKVAVQQLILDDCDIDGKMFDLIANAIKQMNVRINTMDISNNLLESDSFLNLKPEFLRNIERTLIMAKCIKLGKGNFRRNLNDLEKNHLNDINNMEQPVELVFDIERSDGQPSEYDKAFLSPETDIKEIEANQNTESNMGVKNDATSATGVLGVFGKEPVCFAAMYKKEEQIASGTAGSKIHKCKGVNDKEPYVTKILDTDLYDVAETEAKFLRECQHENVVRYYNFCYGNSETIVYIVMEMCAASVYDFVKNEKYLDDKGTLHMTGAKNYLNIKPLQILRDAVKGVLCLHEKKMIHRDLKPNNFLISFDGKVKVTDFGFCRKLNMGKSYHRSESRSAENFLAPENHSKLFKQKSDIYVLGLFFYFVLTEGNHPFGEENDQRHNMTKGNPPTLNPLKEKYEEHYISVSSLIEAMLQKEVDARPTIQMVEKHPALWDSKTKSDFLRDLHGFVEDKSKLTLNLTAQMKKYPAKLLRDNANNEEKFQISKNILPKSVLADKVHPVDPCSTVVHFLRIVRHKKSHGNLTPEEKREIGENPGNGWDNFVTVFLKPVPHLLVHLYEVFKDRKIPNRANYYPGKV